MLSLVGVCWDISGWGPEPSALLPAAAPVAPAGARETSSPGPISRPRWRRRVLTPPSSSWSNRTSRRSEEHTSELQSRFDLVCRLLLEKKNTTQVVHARAHARE